MTTECKHDGRVIRGANIPLRWGSAQSQICMLCGWFRQLTHHGKPQGGWQHPDKYEAAIAESEE